MAAIAASQFGRDKVTILASPGIASLGAWLEQLLAESTGKDGKGLVPIDGEALSSPDVYGFDRMFVYLRLKPSPDAAQDAWADALVRAGHPLVRIGLDDLYDLGAEFFSWQLATAVAASILTVMVVLAVPLTFDPAAWYFGRSLVGLALILAPGVWGAVQALAGRPILAPLLADGQPAR